MAKQERRFCGSAANLRIYNVWILISELMPMQKLVPIGPDWYQTLKSLACISVFELRSKGDVFCWVAEMQYANLLSLLLHSNHFWAPINKESHSATDLWFCNASVCYCYILLSV